MIEEIRYKWRLRRLFLAQEKDKDLYHGLWVEAKAEGKSDDELGSLHAETSSVLSQHQDDIALLSTQHLIETARRLLLPIPPRTNKDMWEDHGGYGPSMLTEIGISNLRSAIRRERKERQDSYIRWTVATTGLLGALIGLIAMLSK